MAASGRPQRRRRPPNRYGEWDIAGEIEALEVEIANLTNQIMENLSTRSQSGYSQASNHQVYEPAQAGVRINSTPMPAQSSRNPVHESYSAPPDQTYRTPTPYSMLNQPVNIGSERPVVEQSRAHYALPRVESQGERQSKLLYLSTITPVKFTGEAREYPSFRERMKHLDDGVLANHELLEFLPKFLDGAALSAFKNMRGMSFAAVMDRFDDRFGHPSKVAGSYIQDLTSGKPITNEDRKGLLDLADKLNSAACSLSYHHYREASCIPNKKRIVDRLPLFARNQWEKKVSKIGEEERAPDLRDLADFVMSHAKAKNNPFYQSAGKDTETGGSSGAGMKGGHTTRKESRQSFLSAVTDVESTRNCAFCHRRGHTVSSCRRFLDHPLSQRYGVAKNHSLCYVCLEPGCIAGRCSTIESREVCRGCRRPHHLALPCNLRDVSQTSRSNNGPRRPQFRHESTPRPRDSTSTPRSRDNTSTPHPRENTSPNQPRENADISSENRESTDGIQCQTTNVSSTYILTTIPVRIHGPNGSIETYALADSGSKISLLDEKLAGRLGISGPTVTRRIKTIRDSARQEMAEVKFEVSSLTSGASADVEAYVMKDVDLTRQLGQFPSVDLNDYEHLADLAIPTVSDTHVTVLLGLPVIEAHEAIRYHRGNADQPYAVETRLGMAVAGPVPDPDPAPRSELLHFVNSLDVDSELTTSLLNNADLTAAMDRFCRMEDEDGSYPSLMQYTANEQLAIRRLTDTIVQRPDGHYECGLLWKDPDCSLPYNRATAERRFALLEKKFLKDPAYAAMYHAAMKETISNGWAVPIPPNEVNVRGPRTFYLSHFGVQNESKPNKVRPVFDSKERTQGVSLNDRLLTGPDITSTLVGVLLRSRTAKVGVAADVKGMFSQCYVSEPDRDSLRFIWYDADGKTPRDYRMQVHIFGAADSPFVANSCLRKAADDHGARYHPDVVHIVRESFYVDDTMFSCPTTREATETARQLKSLLAQGGFELIKFVSNDREVLQSLDHADLARPEVDLQMDDLPGTKTLGLKWDLETDTLGFTISDRGQPDTMRGLVSVVAQIFDPLGLACPVVLAGRLLVQECWRQGLEWDSLLPTDLLSRVRKWRSSLPQLEEVRIPRPYFPLLSTCLAPGVKLQLHLFSDASSEATGCVGYLRALEPSGRVHVGIIMGKARVLPKRPKLTVPRAELKAAVEAVRLGELLKTELRLQLPEENVFYWTDSEIVLKYLSNEKTRFHVYVAHRQSEIRARTKIEQWNFCPGALNPADYPSRGVDPGRFSGDHPFLLGPNFLTQPPDQWPRRAVDTCLQEDDPEVKVMVASVDPTSAEDNHPVIALLERCSRYTRVKRTLVWIHRLAEAIRERRKVDSSTPFSIHELEDADVLLIKSTQGHFYADEIAKLRVSRPITQSPILGLNPYLDDVGILRSASRLTNAQMDYVTKFPSILPSPNHSRLSRLLLEHYHLKLAHGGQDLVLTTSRERYHIVHAKSYVRSLIHGCVICRKRNAVPVDQIMGDLPVDRFRFYEPVFAATGTDCCGPFLAKQGRRTLKYYAVVFRCLTTGARHIEMVKNLDTDSMILAMMRSVALRGGVTRIRSDNGTNYVGSERALRELVEAWNEDRMTKEMAVRGVDWAFQPPYASSQSGIWERSVKETKRHLYAILGKSTPDVEVLRTVLYEVSAILNQVPLCAASDDPATYEALTPGHFLYGKRAALLAPVPTEPDCIYKSRWRQAQQLSDAFWRRFIREYVPRLGGRDKWKIKRRNLRRDDLVILVDSDLPRSHWRIGRVTAVNQDRRGDVRSAIVRTKSGTYTRPIQKFGLLLPAEGPE